ncbi:MAG: hypothetical protein QNJ41_04410 [Xenococcaceae cyanobacterium MO_188.B32]|nr:hypothetical protein [Xenococcaceae cyanobacterium MO_188.B32]
MNDRTLYDKDCSQQLDKKIISIELQAEKYLSDNEECNQQT